MDDTYIDKAIMKLFMIDIINLIQTKAVLLKNFRLQPSEVDAMPYWEYEYLLLAINKQVQDENDRQQAEMDKYKINERMNAIPTSPPKFEMPKMPDMGRMKF